MDHIWTTTYFCMAHKLRKVFTCLFIFLKYLFIYLFLLLAALGLRCCAQSFSSCGEQRLLCCGARASHWGSFSCYGARALGVRASVVVTRGLSSCGLRALERKLCSCGCTGLLAPWSVGRSQTRAWTRVSCIGRQILNPAPPRKSRFLLV